MPNFHVFRQRDWARVARPVGPRMALLKWVSGAGVGCFHMACRTLRALAWGGLPCMCPCACAHAHASALTHPVPCHARRTMVTQLLQHERICTTLPKAQALQRYADRVITLGKRVRVRGCGSMLEVQQYQQGQQGSSSGSSSKTSHDTTTPPLVARRARRRRTRRRRALCAPTASCTSCSPAWRCGTGTARAGTRASSRAASGSRTQRASHT